MDKALTQERRNQFFNLKDEDKGHCPHCGRPETTQHLLVTCPMLTGVWGLMQHTMRPLHEYLNGMTVDQKTYLDKVMPVQVFEMATAARYGIWLARNKALFKQRFRDERMVVSFVLHYITRRCIEIHMAVQYGWAPKKLVDAKANWMFHADIARQYRNELQEEMREEGYDATEIEFEDEDGFAYFDDPLVLEDDQGLRSPNENEDDE
jgi:hypothetical protein